MNDDGTMNILSSKDLHEVLPNYDLSVIKYSVLKMKEAKLINAKIFSYDDSIIDEFLIIDIMVMNLLSKLKMIITGIKSKMLQRKLDHHQLIFFCK